MLANSWQIPDLETLKREWRDADFGLLLFPIFLTILGGIAIYSADFNAKQTNWWQHWVMGGIGLGILVAIARSHYDQLLRLHWITYAITNLSLMAVLLVGTSALGAERWLSIGGFNLQPSEFAKVGVIISLAAVLHNRPIQHPMDILKVVWVVIPPWILIFLQPNLGTALVFAAITIGMLYWAGASLGWLVLLGSPIISAIIFTVYVPVWIGWVALMGVTAWYSLPWIRTISAIVAVVVNLVAAQVGHILWGLLHDYQKQRLLLFLDPSQDPLGGGYHLIQSRIAIGAGKLWGQGLMKGTQTQLNFIPEQHTDFIFSAIGEEFGFIGCMFVLITFLGICWRLLAIAVSAKDNFGSLIAIGVFSFILFQTFVNIGMNIGVAPVTGIPLPWLSYGRSAMIANFMAIGIVESVAAHRRTIKF
ncbi:rod shape-determining protein RodA [Tumidithrix elongata RA019]|uniref:Peptidoglycan glycosyltransferase RodA n=1 Tax=Tumidithrix elongata BACA0141 TaxID=2716417 RepID=A0AAW9Q464_9CYAN|nr:rod shape-determining protein RodA [Tumidithrix elongata RA019]